MVSCFFCIGGGVLVFVVGIVIGGDLGDLVLSGWGVWFWVLVFLFTWFYLCKFGYCFCFGFEFRFSFLWWGDVAWFYSFLRCVFRRLLSFWTVSWMRRSCVS